MRNLPPTFQGLVRGGIGCSTPTPLAIARWDTQPPVQHCSALQPADMKLVQTDDWRGETDELKDNEKSTDEATVDPFNHSLQQPLGGSLFKGKVTDQTNMSLARD